MIDVKINRVIEAENATIVTFTVYRGTISTEPELVQGTEPELVTRYRRMAPIDRRQIEFPAGMTEKDDKKEMERQIVRFIKKDLKLKKHEVIPEQELENEPEAGENDV